MHKKTPPLLTVKKSRNGKGIFAAQPLKKGEILFKIDGVIAHYKELLNRPGKFQNNAFRIKPNHYLSPTGEFANFLNHSCEPNSKITKTKNSLYIVAAKNISDKTEILIDYSTTLAADDIWKMACNCGSKNCRKIIKNFTSLPAPLQKKYKSSGLVPKYILDISMAVVE
jgi:SET domain-containing protein